MPRTAEEVREYNRLKAQAYRASRTPEQHEIDKQKHREWFQQNKNHKSLRSRRLRQGKEYYNRNRERILAQEKEITLALRLGVLNKLGGKCSACGLSDHRAFRD